MFQAVWKKNTFPPLIEKRMHCGTEVMGNPPSCMPESLWRVGVLQAGFSQYYTVCLSLNGTAEHAAFSSTRESSELSSSWTKDAFVIGAWTGRKTRREAVWSILGWLAAPLVSPCAARSW